MTKLEVSIRVTARTKRELKALINKAIVDTTEEIFTKSQENLVERDERGFIITDTSDLLTSGNIIHKDGESLIEYSAPHASTIEWGSSPHTPSIDPLQSWVIRKLGKDEKAAEYMALAIQKKIEREGTQPRRFMRNAIDEVEAKFKNKKIKIKR